MNFSTNQVMQLHVIAENESAAVKPIYGVDGETVKGYIVQIKNGEEVIDTSDIIDAKNILSKTLVSADAANEKLVRKGLLVALNPKVNGGKPVGGREYVLTLTYRGFGEEDTYSKVVSTTGVAEEAAAPLLQRLAEALIDNNTEYSALYHLYLADGTAITKKNLTSITDAGFYVVEPVPYWSLGRFAESLMNIDVQTNTIFDENSVEVREWLANYKFAAVPSSLKLAAIPNTHRVADLEYFCKGERGTSNALVGWPDTPDYVAKVNPKSTKGYDILTVHCAFVGANASNQKSEKDIIFVAEHGAEGINSVITGIESALV